VRSRDAGGEAALSRRRVADRGLHLVHEPIGRTDAQAAERKLADAVRQKRSAVGAKVMPPPTAAALKAGLRLGDFATTLADRELSILFDGKRRRRGYRPNLGRDIVFDREQFGLSRRPTCPNSGRAHPLDIEPPPVPVVRYPAGEMQEVRSRFNVAVASAAALFGCLWICLAIPLWRIFGWECAAAVGAIGAMNTLYAARLLLQGARSRRSEVVLGALNLLCLLGVAFLLAVFVFLARGEAAALHTMGSPSATERAVR